MTLAAELEVEPLGHRVDADVVPPGSKSLTNRALVAAALAQGRSVLEGVLHADDTEAMVGCLAGLGAPIRADWAAGRLTVEGAGGTFAAAGDAELDARMSGTTARFVAPLLGLGRRERRLTGHPQLLARPMGPVLDALRGLGVDVVEEGEPGHLPVLVRAAGGVRGGRIALPGHVSSQFLSGLLLAGPAMDDGLEVELTSELVSRPYVALTVATMRDFGVEVDIGLDGRTFAVGPGRYRAGEHRIEPDATAASYFLAAAAVCGGRVRIAGLGSASVQGDVGFAALLGSMGASVEQGTDWTELRSSGSLRGVTVDLADLSDTAPTLAVVAACATTPTRVTGIGFIRKKESDRIGAVVAQLRRCGVDADEEDDGFVVRPDPAALHGARIETYDDHRMAMSFAVLGLRVRGVTILDPSCVSKTYPRFFEAIDALR
jgi:3-phosphoshikimate 1-carboxyvinyltransferase